MTVLNPDAPQPEAVLKNNIDTNLPQQNVDANQSQEPKSADGQQQEAKEPEKPEDPNWRAFREARKKDRAEREAAERRAAEKEAEAAALKAAMEAAFAKGNPSPQAYQQYYGMNQGYAANQEETEDQRIDRKVNEIIAKKEEQYKREQYEHEQREYPNKLKRDFPDFAHVCSQENLDYLDYHYPELSRPLQRLPEGYDKWSDIYHAVKKFIPNHSTVKKDAMRTDVNANKPRSMSTPGPSPTGDAPRQTWQEIEARRAENWARMQRTLKGV